MSFPKFAHRPEPSLEPPPGSITDAFLKNDIQMRIEEKTTEVPNWFTGKKTAIGVGVMIVAGILGHFFKVKVPVQEISNYVELVDQNWVTLTQLAAGAFTIYGLIAKQLRHDKEVAVVKAVAVEAVAEVRKAEAVVDDTKTELRAVKTDLHATKVELAEVVKLVPPDK